MHSIEGYVGLVVPRVYKEGEQRLDILLVVHENTFGKEVFLPC